MKIHDLEQGSASWYAARLGVVTASEVDALITPKWKVREGAGVDTYVYRKVAEKLLNYSPDQLNTFPMDQGKLIETIAVPWFEFEFGKKVKRVGFVSTDDGAAGCSPDGMLEDGSGLEIKSPQAPNHIKYLLEGKLPEDYSAQVHFSMYVTGAAYWTFVSYHLVLPAFVLRVDRDPAIQAALQAALGGFLAKYGPAIERVKSLRDAA
jgi:hypothetical protein